MTSNFISWITLQITNTNLKRAERATNRPKLPENNFNKTTIMWMKAIEKNRDWNEISYNNKEIRIKRKNHKEFIYNDTGYMTLLMKTY